MGRGPKHHSILLETSTERKDIEKLARFDIEHIYRIFKSNEDRNAYRLLQDVCIKSNRDRSEKVRNWPVPTYHY
jgi:hypothetical protein